MIQIVLDVSANTFKNDINYFENMVKQIDAIDSNRYNIVFKTQLFSKDSEAAKVNKLLHPRIYEKMNLICEEYGYSLTSSVFDRESLIFLLQFIEYIPFIKIACRPDLYHLLSNIPDDIPVYVSVDCRESIPDITFKTLLTNKEIRLLKCIPEYPANTKEYIKNIFGDGALIYANIVTILLI